MLGAVLLAPGAGSSAGHPSLLAIEQRVARPGRIVRRMDFPYRVAGRKVPDKERVLLKAVAEEAGRLMAAGSAAPSLIIGGRSMGGRICSLAAASGLVTPVAGLVLIAYPLHPPGKPDRLRVEHFPDLHVPCLFVSGTRDAFGSPAELALHTAAIAGPVRHVWIEGGAHELRKRDDQVADLVASWVDEVLSSSAST